MKKLILLFTLIPSLAFSQWIDPLGWVDPLSQQEAGGAGDAKDLKFDDSAIGSGCLNVQCVIEYLDSAISAIVGAVSVITDNADGTYTHSDGDVPVLATIDTRALSNPYDNTISELTADNVKEAIDEVDATLDGVNDYTSVLTDNADSTYNHFDGNVTNITIDTKADSNFYDNTTSGATSINMQDLGDELYSLVTSISTLRFIDQYPLDDSSYLPIAETPDGVITDFTINAGVYVTGTLQVFLNGQQLTQGTNGDWQELVPASGTFSFTTPPLVTDKIIVQYNNAISDVANLFLPKGTAGSLQYKDGSQWNEAVGTYWDDVNNYLGLGTATPDGLLDIEGGEVYLPLPNVEPLDANFANNQYNIWSNESNDSISFKYRNSLGTIDQDYLFTSEMVHVLEASDLPTPTDTADGLGLAYRLENGKRYIFHKSFEISNPIVPSTGFSQIESFRGINLKYTGTGGMIRSNATTFPLHFFTFGIVLEGDGTNTGLDLQAGNKAEFNYTELINFADLGDQKNFTGFVVNDGCSWTNFSHGMDWENNTISYINRFAGQPNGFMPTGGIVNISGNFLSVAIQDGNFVPVAGNPAFNIDPAINGFVVVGASNVVKIAGGVSFDSTGIDQTDPRVIFSNNRGVPDSGVFVNQKVDADKTTGPQTTYLTQNQPILINNTFLYGTQERYLGVSDGRVAYTGLETHSSIAHFAMQVIQDNPGSDQDYAVIPAIENPTTMLVTAISDAGGGNIDIDFNNPHGLEISDRFTLFNMTDSSYDLTYTVVSVIDTDTVQVVGTFTTTATGEWRKILDFETRQFNIVTANDPVSVGANFSIENLETGDVVVFVTEALEPSFDPLRFYYISNIMN